MALANTEPGTTDMLRHVAIIMDGNGRWAKARGLPRAMGHQHGADAVRRVVRAARELGLEYLTLFAFSSENWRRPVEEVRDLMGLLRLYLRREIKELAENNIRLRVIGDLSALSDDLQKLICDGEALTERNTALTLVIAINYGGHADIVRAARELALAVSRGEIAPEDITEQQFAGALYTADLPDPDLLIRTSGEQRISNFLLWQLAYSELVFDPVLWPDFDKSHLERAIADFQQRDRRFGGRVT